MENDSSKILSPYDAPIPKYADIWKLLDSEGFSGVGDAHSMGLYQYVGMALGNFEKIQDELVLLFDQLCGGTFGFTSKMAQIIGATSSFNVKMDLTKQAVRSFLLDEKKESVLKWLKLTHRASLIRNKIAHGQVIRIQYMKDGVSQSGAFWAPSRYDTKKINTLHEMADWDYCWNGHQLYQYVSAFHLVFAMLLTVREELAGKGDQSTGTVLDPDRM